MASSMSLRKLLLRLPKTTFVPHASYCRYYMTIGCSSGKRHADASSCIAEYYGPVGHFVLNPLRTALYYFTDMIYPYTPTNNLRWSLNFMNYMKSQAFPRSFVAHIKSCPGRWDVTETARNLRLFRDMGGLEQQDVKVWVEEGTKLMKPEKVWVENGNYVSDEGPKVFGQLLERNVYGTSRLCNVFLSPSMTPFMKAEELKRSEYTEDADNIIFSDGYFRFNISYPEMPYPSVSLFIKFGRQKGYEGEDCVEPYTVRIGLPGNVYKTNDIKIEVKDELLKVIVPKMTVKRVRNLKCILESDHAGLSI